MNRAVFLDRDGTIARDVPYCRRPEDFTLLTGAGEGIKLLHQNGFKIIIVTNQSGIARGYFDEDILAKIHRKMNDDLAGFGTRIDAIYYCPHHPDDNCACRKPKKGMLVRAAGEMDIDIAHSYLIGDKEIDVAAAKNAGCKAILIRDGDAGPDSLSPGQDGAKADFICHDFLTGVAWVIADNNSQKGGKL
jgi:histidinol-phosphate phosphatase family protein